MLLVLVCIVTMLGDSVSRCLSISSMRQGSVERKKLIGFRCGRPRKETNGQRFDDLVILGRYRPEETFHGCSQSNVRRTHVSCSLQHDDAIDKKPVYLRDCSNPLSLRSYTLGLVNSSYRLITVLLVRIAAFLVFGVIFQEQRVVTYILLGK